MNIRPKGTVHYENYNPEIIKYLLETVQCLQSQITNMQILQKQEMTSQSCKMTHLSTRQKRLVDFIEVKTDWIDENSRRWLIQDHSRANRENLPNSNRVSYPNLFPNNNSNGFHEQSIKKPATILVPNSYSDQEVVSMLSAQNIKLDSAIIKRFDPEKTEINSLISTRYEEKSDLTDPSLQSESGIGTSSMGQEPIIQMDQPMSNMSSESEFESDLVGTATNSDESRYPVIGNLEVSHLFSPETVFESSQLGRKLKRTFENVAGRKRTRYEKRDLEGALKALIEESDFNGIVDLFERISSQATDEEKLTQHLNRAKCFKYFYTKKFDDLYKLVDAFVFERDHHSELQKLWYEARYQDEQVRLDKERKSKKLPHRTMGPVDKYRIRKKYQLPATIWDGMPIKKGYRESSRDLMRKFYERNNYPTLEERRLIAEQSGLNIEQVKNWFKNRRKRESDKLGICLTGGPMRSLNPLDCQSSSSLTSVKIKIQPNVKEESPPKQTEIEIFDDDVIKIEPTDDF